MTKVPGPVLAVAILGFSAAAPAQQQHMDTPGMNMPAKTMPGMDMHETRSNLPFRPGLGDLMTAFVQPHHIKLGLAGAARNWPLADYELDELRETFDDAGRLILKHGKLAIPDAIKSTVAQPMDAVGAAIKAKDQAAFTKAYGDLTAACNACHQSADHPMIVIKVPDVMGTAYPDQDFNPPK
jgi:hypothetical protein